MKKTIATAAAIALLLAGGASAASAETLTRTKGKATITAQGAPVGATVTKARITVKKGKKTVARNKSSYRAKKGTYKVTSTFTSYPVITVTPKSYDLIPECRVTGAAITSDRTTQTRYGSAEWGWDGYRSGQITVSYTGTCTAANVWVDDARGNFLAGLSVFNLTWDASWPVDETVWIDGYSVTDAQVAADIDYRIGDVTYVDTSDLSALPTVQVHAPAVTTKSTRTVIVR